MINNFDQQHNDNDGNAGEGSSENGVCRCGKYNEAKVEIVVIK